MVLGLIVAAGAVAGAGTGGVFGFIRDASNGEFLEYVNVYLSDNSMGTASSSQGYYVLTGIPPGKYTLVASRIGYEVKKIVIRIEPDGRARKDLRLSPAPIGMQQIEVTGERSRFEHQVDVGIKRMDFPQMVQVPGFVEQDLFRALSMLPGVTSVSDFTSALYIRGGTMDQNLVLLDGVKVYNPYHLLGLFSTFILEPLKGAQLYTGGYPASYGGAVSAVLDVRMKAGNSERLAGYTEVGLLTSKLVVEGPLPLGAKGSWIVAGRRTYIDAITWSLNKIFKKSLEESGIGSIYLPYHFYDLQTKLNWDATQRSRFTVSGFFGDDVLDFEGIEESPEDLKVQWGNGTLGLRWRYIFTPELFSLLGFDASRYRVHIGVAERDTAGEVDYAMTFRSGIGELGLRWGLSWFPKTSHTIDFGLEGKLIELSNRYIEEEPSYDQVTVWMDEADTFLLAGLYLEDKWEPTPMWVIDAGVRGEYFSEGSYFRASPRLGLKRRITADWALKAGAGLYYQYLYVPYPRDEMMLKIPIEFFQQWMAADQDHPPLNSKLATLGTEYRFQKPAVNISLEAYYKHLGNLREAGLFEEGPFADTTTIQLGKGYSYGAEALLEYKNSWLGYSYSVTRYRFGEEEWFYPVHDNRHSVNLSFLLPLGKKWNITAAWVFSSGFPFTAQIGWVQYVREDGRISWKEITGRHGDYRYPPYHRLDLGVTKTFRMLKKLDAEFYLQVLNVYARKNVLYYDYWLDQEGVTHLEPRYMIPIPVPSFGLRARW